MEQEVSVEKHEVKLTEKQLQIIQGIFQAKQMLEQEFNKVVQRESEFIVNLCEAKGIEAVQGIEFKDGAMLVPKTQPTYTEATKKKLKKVE
jgi:hypothetical protein